MTNSNAVKVGDKLSLVINFVTRTCEVVRVYNNGRIRVQAEAVYPEKTGRRLYAAQAFTLDATEIR